MATRPLLSDEHKSESVLRAQVKFGQSVVDEVRQAVERDPLVVVGMAQNPFVKKARRALEGAGVTFTYLEYGSYFTRWRDRLAIKLWSGWPTFPQVFVKGTLIGGFNDTEQALGDGSLKQRLDGEG